MGGGPGCDRTRAELLQRHIMSLNSTPQGGWGAIFLYLIFLVCGKHDWSEDWFSAAQRPVVDSPKLSTSTSTNEQLRSYYLPHHWRHVQGSLKG